MFRGLERFSVAAPGRVVNEYRIRGGKLELRTWNPLMELPKEKTWRKLGNNEIMLHLLLKTVVGRWLTGRRGFHGVLEEEGLPATRHTYKQAV